MGKAKQRSFELTTSGLAEPEKGSMILVVDRRARKTAQERMLILKKINGKFKPKGNRSANCSNPPYTVKGIAVCHDGSQ